jgi:hypothetical protein
MTFHHLSTFRACVLRQATIYDTYLFIYLFEEAMPLKEVSNYAMV